MPTYANALTSASDSTDTAGLITRHDVETAAGNTYEGRITLTAGSAADVGLVVGVKESTTGWDDLSGYLILIETDDDELRVDRRRDGVLGESATANITWGDHVGEELTVAVDYRDSDPDALTVSVDDSSGTTLGSASLSDATFDWGGVGFYRFHAGSDWYLDSFAAPQGSVSVATRPHQNVTRHAVQLVGEVTDLGGYGGADAWFEYRQQGASEWQTTSTQSLNAAGTFSATVAGLTAGGDYEFRALAAAADGTVDATSSPRSIRTLAVNVFETWDDGPSALDKYVGHTGQFAVVESNTKDSGYAATSDGAHARILTHASGDGPLRPSTFVQSFYPINEAADRMMVHFGVQEQSTDSTRYAAVADHANGVIRFGSNLDGWSYVETSFNTAGTAHQYNDLIVDWGDSDPMNEIVQIEYRDHNGNLLMDAPLEVPLTDQVGDEGDDLMNALSSGGWGYSLWSDAGGDPDYRIDFMRILGVASAPQNLEATRTGQHDATIAWDPPTRGEIDSYIVYVDGSEDTTVGGDTTEATIDNLDRATTYTVEVSALDPDGNETARSNAIGVTTIDAAIGVETEVPTNVGDTRATFRGELTVKETSLASVTFEWREVGAASWTETQTQVLEETGPFSHEVTTLTSGVAYEVRVIAEDSEGNMATGTTHQFETGSTTWGLYSPTRRVRETGTTSRELPTDLGIGEDFFAPDTTYEFRAVATDPSRNITTRGDIQTVTTAAESDPAPDPTWTTLEDFGHQNLDNWWAGATGEYATSNYWATSGDYSAYNTTDRAGMMYATELDRTPVAGETIRFDIYASHGTSELSDTLRHRFRFAMSGTDAFYDVYIDLWTQQVVAVERDGSNWPVLATGTCDPIVGEQRFYGEIGWNTDGTFTVEYFGDSGGSLSDRLQASPTRHQSDSGTIGLVHHSKHVTSGQTATLRTDNIRVREE